MKNNDTLNKTSVILSIIVWSVMALVGVLMLGANVFGILEHYGVIASGWEIINFSWLGVIVTFVIAFCFIFFSIKKVVKYIKHLRNGTTTQHINSYVVSSQTESTNLTDVEDEHNRYLKNQNLNKDSVLNTIDHANANKVTQTKQVNTKPSKALIIVLAVFIAMFGIPALLVIVNSILPNEYKMPDVSTDWVVAVFIFLMMLPLIFWQISELRTYFAIKNNKPIKQIPFASHIFGLIIMSIFIIAPFLPIWTENKIQDDLFVGIIYWGFVIFLTGLLLFGYLRSIINYCINKKIANNSSFSQKGMAKYLGCRYSNSTTKSVNGVPVKLNVKYNIKFSYVDENGIERTKTSFEEFTFNEVAYLKYKQEFAILMHKNHAVIAEDLTNIVIPQNVNIDAEKNNSSTFLPSFAKKHRWLLSFVLSFVVVAILEIAGIGMWINPEGSDSAGITCVVIGVLLLFGSIWFCIPNILAEYKGKEVYGMLIKLEVRRSRRTSHDSNRKYAVVNIDGEIKNIFLLYDEWYSVLGAHVGSTIPLKVFGKTAVVDFQKLYSDLI